MTTQHYKYEHKPQHANAHPNDDKPVKVSLKVDQCAGHGDHWAILTDNIAEDVPNWLQQSIDTAVMKSGLRESLDKNSASHLLLSGADLSHINQLLAMKDGKPHNFVNAYPCIDSPYGMTCKIERIITNEVCAEGILRLVSEDGSVIYAFDQLYAVNHELYRSTTPYFVQFSGWAYSIEPSDQSEVILVEDPEAIRYHRAFNDIVAKNDGKTPVDLEKQIQAWQPDTDEPLAPVEINLGHMCAYLFGETLGQEDEAWCQGQVLGKQTSTLCGNELCVMDVAILREPDASPFVVRIATPTTKATKAIKVNDYIQANIWLQAAIYRENQNP